MNVILAYVCSADGFLTDPKGSEAPQWASSEDQEHFRRLASECDAAIMGSNTYEKHKLGFAEGPRLRRIVMTRTPKKYTGEIVAPGVEFSSLSPQRLITSLKKEGLTNVLISGGPGLYGECLEQGLITELQITTEPLLFGRGLSAASTVPLHTKLELIDITRLNQRGTLLARYKVL